MQNLRLCLDGEFALIKVDWAITLTETILIIKCMTPVKINEKQNQPYEGIK